MNQNSSVLMLIRDQISIQTAKKVADNGMNLILGICEAQYQNIKNLSELGNIFVIPWKKNYSEARNYLQSMSPHGWITWINPWEEIITNINYEELDKRLIYAATHVHNNVISRPARIWHTDSGVKWSGKIFESPTREPDKISDLILTGSGLWFDEDFLLTELEKLEPHNPQVDYYRAMKHLVNKNYKEFQTAAARFLFRSSKITDAVIMTRYYLAAVEIRALGNHSAGLGHLVLAIAERPWMAEFWCLAAESFRRQGQMIRAAALYENAIVFGQRRPGLDSLPLEVSSYDEEPNKFLDLFKSNAK